MRGGYQRRTTDGVIGISGQPVRVYGVQVQSTAIAGRAIFYNGTDATGDRLFDADGEPNATKNATDVSPEGAYFPGGCFVDIDANTTAVIVRYEQVISR